MNSRSLLRFASFGGLAGLVLGASQSAWAIPSVSLSTTGPLWYNSGIGTKSLTVDFRVQLAAGDTVNDVMTYFGPIVGYNPAILKFNGISYGTALTSTAVPEDTPVTGPVNYLDPFGDGSYTPDASIAQPNPTYALGSGPVPVTVPPAVSTTYYDGSLWNLLNVGVGFGSPTHASQDLADLFAKQSAAGGALLYSITFDVITDYLGTSSIVLITDQDYLQYQADPNPNNAAWDAKYWDGGNNTPFFPQGDLQVTIPVPAPLALIAAGLVGLGMRRRSR